MKIEDVVFAIMSVVLTGIGSVALAFGACLEDVMWMIGGLMALVVMLLIGLRTRGCTGISGGLSGVAYVTTLGDQTLVLSADRPGVVVVTRAGRLLFVPRGEPLPAGAIVKERVDP